MSSFACMLMENHFTFTTYRELKYFSASCQIVEQNDSSNYINVFNLEQRIQYNWAKMLYEVASEVDTG